MSCVFSSSEVTWVDDIAALVDMAALVDVSPRSAFQQMDGFSFSLLNKMDGFAISMNIIGVYIHSLDFFGTLLHEDTHHQLPCPGPSLLVAHSQIARCNPRAGVKHPIPEHQ
jgi:hypothetical protein